MYRYNLDISLVKVPLVINIIKSPLNKQGFADINSINIDYIHKLNRAKNRINDIDASQWEEVKKITNPHEFIHAFNSKSKGNDIRSIAIIKPLSRSFFKMIEMIYEFYPLIITNENKLNTVHIAEGPGGFIEAVRYIRYTHHDDHAFGITLVKFDNKNKFDNTKFALIPGWKQSNYFLQNNPEVHIINGIDGTGDIYKPDNIEFLKNEVLRISECKEGVMFITADGGFDYSIDYNYQEQSSCKLIFSQILGALKCQAQGGMFICKFFDINLLFTVEMLYLLYCMYETVTIYKPLTSRIANSEKYIICNNFKAYDDPILFNNQCNILTDVLRIWNTYTNETINHILVNIPLSFIEHIKSINKEIIDLQIKSISTSIDIIRNKKISLDKAWYDNNVEKQLKNAREWCEKYNIPYRH